MAKILLVEDDNNLREIYEARLKAEGYDIASASNGEEALVVAKKEQPDLVIADVMMPRISGFEMLDILRNTQGLEHVKVIMLTALGQAEDKTRADQLGADRYLVKSQVTLEDIVKAASDLLASAGAPTTPTSNAVQPNGDTTSQQQPSAAQAPQMQQPQPAVPTTSSQQPLEPAAPPQPEPAQQLRPQPEPPQSAPTTPQQQAAPTPTTPPPMSKPDVVARPPSQPAQAQPAAQTQPPQPAQEPATQDNTTQLSNAVKDLISDTNGGNSNSQPAPTVTQLQPTAPPQPAASAPSPASSQSYNDSVTISGKRTIKPIGPGGAEKPHINDLLAKEEASSTDQHDPASGSRQLPTTPHPAGHVFSPTAQPPQNTSPEAPNDPNKIAL